MEKTVSPKYPVGEYCQKDILNDMDTDEQMFFLKHFPEKLRKLVENLSDMQLDEQIRPGAWRIRQIVHHLADVHMNAYMRFKLALTEQNPIVKTYDEPALARLQDSFTMAVSPSLDILHGVHARWVFEIKSLTNNELDATYFHPEMNRKVTLRENLAYYTWHSEHHFMQIHNFLIEKGWLAEK